MPMCQQFLDNPVALIDTLTRDFNRSESFENPVLQQHYMNLEALALDLLEPEKAEDLTGKTNLVSVV